MIGLSPIEAHLRTGERLEASRQLVVRGWPLTIDGLLRNADATRRRYSLSGEPFIAISAEVTAPEWNIDAILAGPRLRTRRSYAVAPVGSLIDAGFELLPTFGAPHYSVGLPAYTGVVAQRLLTILGSVRPNPHHERRER